MTDNQQGLTVVTFAPVQGFIEKSRKLRDLYGSSYLLSFLAQAICRQAEQDGHTVVSPALPDITQGLPNQIIIQGNLDREAAYRCFMASWRWVVDGCREWIEAHVQEGWQYEYWHREWNLWAAHSWEFFCVHSQKNSESISEVRQRINEEKRQRAWTAVNWQGESSTLSGADAVAWPHMGKPHNAKHPRSDLRKDPTLQKTPIEMFYGALSEALGRSFAKRYGLPETTPKIQEYGNAFVDPDEELSIPELVKRLITHAAIVDFLRQRSGRTSAPAHLADLAETLEQDLNIKSFRELNRLPQKNRSSAEAEPVEKYWTGWFVGDGDGASDYLKWVGQHNSTSEASLTSEFSLGMRDWGKQFKAGVNQHSNQKPVVPEGNGRVVYAGGDDFLGVLYGTSKNKPLQDKHLPPNFGLQWLSTFKSQVWEGLAPWPGENEKITASVGYVWASPQVPQRDVLQHARQAEQAAKAGGKDRVAMRVLFASGNHLEWVCPWWILEAELFQKYRDRNGVVNAFGDANWNHFYSDVAALEARHGFTVGRDTSPEIAIALFNLYFEPWSEPLDATSIDDTGSIWWNQRNAYKVTKAGILGERDQYLVGNTLDIDKVNQAINSWIINLAKVGFQLCSDISSKSSR